MFIFAIKIVIDMRHTLHALSLREQKDENEMPRDLVLSDVHIPVMNGLELLTCTHKFYNIPINIIIFQMPVSFSKSLFSIFRFLFEKRL